MNTPPSQPGSGKPNKAKLSLEQQLDELLVQIEEVEPGTLDPDVLPKSEREAAYKRQAALPTPDKSDDRPAPADSAPLKAPPQAPAKPETSPEQADMLAALNSALQGIGTPADEPAQPAATPDEALSMEDKLQAEIAALMNAEPEVAKPAPAAPPATEIPDDELEGSFESPASAAATTQAAAPAPRQTSSTEDQIAMEIEGLLNTNQAEPATERTAESGIDELDKMLAQEIDADDELLGDFQSVEQLTAGIQVPEQADHLSDDAHAATARDVAAELDSQPEDLPQATFEPVQSSEASSEDPFAVLEELAVTAKKNQDEHEQRVAMQMPDWVYWIETARVRLLNICFLLNWPARRFLSTEWRANLGYIALLNLFFGVGLWIVLILF